MATIFQELLKCQRAFVGLLRILYHLVLRAPGKVDSVFTLVLQRRDSVHKRLSNLLKVTPSVCMGRARTRTQCLGSSHTPYLDFLLWRCSLWAILWQV